MSAVGFGFLIMRAPTHTILFRTQVGKRQRAGSAIFGTKLYRISLRGLAAANPARQCLAMYRGRSSSDFAEPLTAGASGPPGITPSGPAAQGHGCRMPS